MEERITNVRGVDVLDEMAVEDLLNAIHRIRSLVRLMVAQPLLIPDALGRLEEEFTTIEERYQTKKRVRVDVTSPEATADIMDLLRRRDNYPTPPEPPPTIDPESDEGKAIRDQLLAMGGAVAEKKTVDVILPIAEEQPGE